MEAVNIAGILTVFAFLILPASLVTFISGSWITKLVAGWTAGIIASFAGLMLSLRLDVPCAPVIIILLGIILLIVYLVWKIRNNIENAYAP